MRTTKPKILVPRLLGLAPDIFDQCSSHFQMRSSVTFFTIIVLHAFASGTISLGLARIFSPLSGIIIFITLFLVLFTIDRALITGMYHWTSTVLRMILLIVFPICNMAFFDFIFFEKDLVQTHQEKNADKAQIIESKYTEKMESIKNEIIDLKNRNIELEDTKKKMAIELNGEADGTTGSKKIGINKVWQSKKATFDSLTISINKERDSNDEEITELKESLNGIEEKSLSEMNSLPGYSQTGLAYRLELLFEKMIKSGSPAMKFVSLGYFLFFFAVDALLLLPVVSGPFQEYNGRVKIAVHQNNLVNELRDTHLFQLQSTEIQIEIEKKLLSLQHEAAIENARSVLQQIEQQLRDQLNYINILQQEDKNVSNRFERDFQRMAYAAVIRSMDQLDDFFAQKV